MALDPLRKGLPAPGQMLVLTLIGLLLLSGLLYYKAVKAQRYLEPSLAIAQPRTEFTQNINSLLETHFGSQDVEGITLSADSILVDHSLIFGSPDDGKPTNTVFLRKLSQIFLAILKDPQMRPRFNLIMVSARLPLTPHLDVNKKKRVQMQHIAEFILDSLYETEPTLEKDYSSYFAATTLTVQPGATQNWVEFRIIPSEFLHIEMIRSLGKHLF